METIQAQSFNHVGIWVRDMRKSADWYIEHLGMEEKSVSGNHIFLKLASGEVWRCFRPLIPSRSVPAFTTLR